MEESDTPASWAILEGDMGESLEDIRAKIEERFVRVACSPHEKQPFLIGPGSARRLGYPAAEIDALPPSVTESFAGVGNPLGLGGDRRQLFFPASDH